MATKNKESMTIRRFIFGTRRENAVVDYSLLFIIIFLLAFGLVMIYSASSYSASMEAEADSFSYVKTQLIAILIGLVMMFVVAKIDYHVWRHVAVVSFFVTAILICLVKSPIGHTSHGASRWIVIGPFMLQPAEIAKIAVIIIMAYLTERVVKHIDQFSVFVRTLIMPGILAVMILLITNNLSSALIIGGIAVIMLFIASRNWRYFILGIMLLFGVGAIYMAVKGGFRMERIMVWLDPEAYAEHGGYQVLQGLYAIGSGGLFGKGLGQSVQKLGFVPEAQNDMIFSIICEELGFIGAVALLLVFGVLIRKIMRVAAQAEDMFGSMIASGIMAHIAIQVLLNVAVVSNSIPNTGVTLPFISYGGTSVLFLLAELGLLFSIATHGKQ